MHSKSILALGLIAVSANLVVAAPPACLLAAVNTEPNPSDLDTICGQDASKVVAQIKSLCGGNSPAAMNAFSSICSSAGHRVATSKLASTKTSLDFGKPSNNAAIGITQGTSTVALAQVTPTTLMLATGGPMPVGNGTMTTPSVITPTSPGASGSGSPGYPGAAGRIDAHGFAALALTAAGLAIFL